MGIVLVLLSWAGDPDVGLRTPSERSPAAGNGAMTLAVQMHTQIFSLFFLEL